MFPCYLPPLEEEGPVDCPEPHDAVPGLEVPQLVAAVVEEVPQTLQQLRGAGLGRGGVAKHISMEEEFRPE